MHAPKEKKGKGKQKELTFPDGNPVQENTTVYHQLNENWFFPDGGSHF